MTLLFVLTILLIILQFAFALIAWNSKSNIIKRFSKPLSSLVTPEKILSQNEKRFSHIKLKLVNKLDDIAFADKGLLFLNKKDFTKNTLYVNYKFVYYFYLAFEENNYVRNFKIFQNTIFALQIFFLILAIVFSGLAFNTFLITSFIIQIFALIFAIYNQILLSSFTKEVFRKCKKILQLDNVEEARLEALMRDITYEAFEYPFDIIWKLTQFFKP